MKLINMKIWVYLFLLVGIGNFVMMIDTILSEPDQTFSVFSIPTGKWINVGYYGTIALFLIYLGFNENNRINQNEN